MTTTYSCDRCGKSLEEIGSFIYEIVIPKEGVLIVNERLMKKNRSVNLCDPCAKGLAEYLKVSL